ncbi:MAG: lysophospholipid acyltransferase family protein [Alphaproteobacteria bacterium]|nr:lysophospholipid acyltransferase family protein [Alphaproteobacteria bacterium]
MGLVKRIGRSAPVRAVLCFLAAGYIRLVHATSRWTVVGGDVPKRFWDEGQPFILAFWHGRILMMPYCWPKGRRMNMLISRHRDGGLIADTIAWFGLGVVRGSTAKPGRERDKGAQAALMEMIRKLKGGEYVGITPDGPRGPRMRASDGVVAVARLAGVPVIACSYATKRRRVLSSWDRFTIPLPFTRGVFVWGRPIDVPAGTKGEALDAARLKVEAELNAVTREADRLAGHDPHAIQPAALEAAT